MKAEADKSESSKSRAVASAATVRQDKDASEGLFSDKRPEAVAQREHAGKADNSPQARKVAQLQAMANGVSVETVQRQGPEEEELLQGKFETIQRQGPEEEELLQGKFETVQRQGPEEDEELLQGKFETIQNGERAETLKTRSVVAQKKDVQTPNNTGLPDTLKSGVENLSGLSMDDVKVHYNSSKPARLQAHAFAQGTDIHMAPGQEKHLPHEAWHVVQQKQGRVKPTMQMKGKVNVNDDAGLEKEADVMGAKALQSTSSLAQNLLNKRVATSPNQPIQAISLEDIWGIADEFDLSYVMLFTAIAAIGLAAAYVLLNNCTTNEEAENALSKVNSKKDKPLEFKEPTTDRELQDCIDKKQYPLGIRTIGNKKDWARRMAGRLGLKVQTYTRRVNRVEITQEERVSNYSSQPEGANASYRPSPRRAKTKTRGALAPAVVPAIAPPPAFVFDNATTWNILAIQTRPGVVALNIAANYVTALTAGMLTDNSTAGGAAVDTNYHAHANGGAAGFAFRYVHTDGTFDVTPTIYDFAGRRTGKSGNIYQWKYHDASNTAPAYP